MRLIWKLWYFLKWKACGYFFSSSRNFTPFLKNLLDVLQIIREKYQGWIFGKCIPLIIPGSQNTIFAFVRELIWKLYIGYLLFTLNAVKVKPTSVCESLKQEPLVYEVRYEKQKKVVTLWRSSKSCISESLLHKQFLRVQ